MHLTVLRGSDSPAGEVAERVYAALGAAGIGVLFDDRGERPGVQFADADLIGLPVRLTVSERSLKAGGIELKRRDADESRIVAEEELVAEIRAELGRPRPEDAGARTDEPRDLARLRAAFELALRAREEGNLPFGCVIVDDFGNVVIEQGEQGARAGAGPDRARRDARRGLGGAALSARASSRGFTLYLSAEPCAMCAGAIYWAGIGRGRLRPLESVTCSR